MFQPPSSPAPRNTHLDDRTQVQRFPCTLLMLVIAYIIVYSMNCLPMDPVQAPTTRITWPRTPKSYKTA